LFGVGYATASLACTIPIFLLVVSTAITSNLIDGMLSFLAYAIGMSLAFMFVSVGTAFSKGLIEAHIRKLMPLIQKLASLLIIAAGIYIIYFQVSSKLLG